MRLQCCARFPVGAKSSPGACVITVTCYVSAANPTHCHCGLLGTQPIVYTESMVYGDPSTLADQGLHSTTQVPVVATESRKVALESEDGVYSATGEIVSSQTISSKTRTVETITYKTEKDGVVETRVEQKITIQSDGDPIDHDRALAEAIQEATAMNPDMTVEKIEIQQQTAPQ
uniref:Band 4.1 C-terminal domain-containing protein n=1 Tax=Timema monikensis TaxID=170555 RepID=A0A7R9HLW1_9NEOP|nr:unnamed protein product [Timema monikensis]